MALNYSEHYLPANFFKMVGQMSEYDLVQLGKKYPQARQTDAGVPVFGMIEALDMERKLFKGYYETGDEKKSAEQTAQEHDLKHENIMSKKIINQTKLSLLIPKKEATDRVKNLFRSVQLVIKNAIKSSAPLLIGITDQREIEQILTKKYNGAVDLFKRGAKIIPWEIDGSADLVMTRLVNLEKDDPEFAEALKERGKLYEENN